MVHYLIEQTARLLPRATKRPIRWMLQKGIILFAVYQGCIICLNKRLGSEVMLYFLDIVD